MGAISIWHVVIVLGVAVLLFGGRGKMSSLMADVAKGIRNFRNELSTSAPQHIDVINSDSENVHIDRKVNLIGRQQPPAERG